MPAPRRLPPLPTVSDIIRIYGLSAKSQLSQNFLLDLNVTGILLQSSCVGKACGRHEGWRRGNVCCSTSVLPLALQELIAGAEDWNEYDIDCFLDHQREDKIVRVAGGLSDCCVCEVGPGPGSLTRSILNAGPRKLVVVEKDRRFLPSLELLRDASRGCVEIHHGDVLEFDVEKVCGPHVEETQQWENDPPKFHVLGNLPFSVSIPLLLQWLSMIPQRKGPFHFGRSQLTLTFQKEVAERITAPPGDTQRSRLSIMAQHLCHVKWGFQLRGKTFVPPPKVDVVVLKLTPLVRPKIDVDYRTLETVVKSLFQYRRKFIRNGARLLFPANPELAAELFRLSGVDDTLRPQQLSLVQFEQLCGAYEILVRECGNEPELENGTIQHSKGASACS